MGGYRLHVHVLYRIHVPGRGGRTREGGRNGERERGSVGGGGGEIRSIVHLCSYSQALFFNVCVFLLNL